MNTKRFFAILLALLTLLSLPVTSFAEEQKPFLFRGRYTWGMSMEEVKQQAEEEGLTVENEQPVYIFYQDVPVAGTIAQRLEFYAKEIDGLDYMVYNITYDPDEALTLYPSFLEQLTLLYGEPDQQDSKNSTVRWRGFDVIVTLSIQDYDGRCRLSYLRVDPEPTPIPLTMDGL